MKIGVSLGSGSFKGICHLGFIKTLEEEGIKPDVIAGSSIGAIMGALWASGKNSNEIIKIFKQMGSKNFLKYISFFVSRKGIIEPKIEKFLKERIGTENFDDLKIKLIVMATDITNGERIKITQGSVLKAVRKSISIPGIMKPVIENDNVIKSYLKTLKPRKLSIYLLSSQNQLPSLSEKHFPHLGKYHFSHH